MRNLSSACADGTGGKAVRGPGRTEREGAGEGRRDRDGGQTVKAAVDRQRHRLFLTLRNRHTSPYVTGDPPGSGSERLQDQTLPIMPKKY